MKRRDLILGAGAATVGAAGLFAFLGPRSPDTVEPVEVETLEAPGSQRGTATVPAPGEVTVVDVFATWCFECRKQMPSLDEARSRLDVEFVSVTNERVGAGLTRGDIADWWRENGGDWTVALDNEGRLTRELGVTRIPYLVVVDADGETVFSHTGAVSASDVVDAVESARQQA